MARQFFRYDTLGDRNVQKFPKIGLHHLWSRHTRTAAGGQTASVVWPRLPKKTILVWNISRGPACGWTHRAGKTPKTSNLGTIYSLLFFYSFLWEEFLGRGGDERGDEIIETFNLLVWRIRSLVRRAYVSENRDTKPAARCSWLHEWSKITSTFWTSTSSAANRSDFATQIYDKVERQDKRITKDIGKT